MKLAVLALVGVLAAGNAMAAEITVTANVDPSCVFDTTEATLAFDTIDPVANTVESTNTATINYTCVAGSTFTIVDDAAGTYELENQDRPGTIAYNLLYNANPLGAGVANGLQQSFTVQATIDAGTYGDATVGNYIDTVTLSFNY